MGLDDSAALSLPKVFFRVLAENDGHVCKCKEFCDPGFDEGMMERAIKQARAENKAIIENDERIAIRAVYRKENAKQIQKEIRARMTQEQTTTIYQEQKAAKRRTWSNSVRAIEAQKVQSSLQAEFENCVSKEVQRRIDKMAEVAMNQRKEAKISTS